KSTPTAVIYPLSLHDALPIYPLPPEVPPVDGPIESMTSPPRPETSNWPTPLPIVAGVVPGISDISPSPPGRRLWPPNTSASRSRSEEHTSELQSRENLVCRLL